VTDPSYQLIEVLMGKTRLTVGAGIMIIVTLFWFSSEGDKTSGFSRRVLHETSSKQRAAAAAVTSNNINAATKTMTTVKFIKKAEELPGTELQTTSTSTAVTRLHHRTTAQPGSRQRKWGQIEKSKTGTQPSARLRRRPKDSFPASLLLTMNSTHVGNRVMEPVNAKYAENIYFSVKTMSRYHDVRLPLLMLTWLQAVKNKV